MVWTQESFQKLVEFDRPEYNTINWRDTTRFDSEDECCRNVSHCQHQQSYSGLRSPGRSNSTHIIIIIIIIIISQKFH